MRTARQIKLWLESHKWYGSFRKQTLESITPIDPDAFRVLAGEYGRHTITAGFFWWTSNEGYRFWAEIDNKFKEWYEKESK